MSPAVFLTLPASFDLNLDPQISVQFLVYRNRAVPTACTTAEREPLLSS